MYQGLADKLGAVPPSPVGPPPATLGLGPIPGMPGLPPPPTGMGAMPTGAPSTDKKSLIDQATLSLRDVVAAVPALGPQVNAWIDQLKSHAITPEQPPVPGAPAASAPLEESGSPGGS